MNKQQSRFVMLSYLGGWFTAAIGSINLIAGVFLGIGGISFFEGHTSPFVIGIVLLIVASAITSYVNMRIRQTVRNKLIVDLKVTIYEVMVQLTPAMGKELYDLGPIPGNIFREITTDISYKIRNSGWHYEFSQDAKEIITIKRTA